ncbi:MAG: fumarylacetoacetate hydrolase family protein, partial [Actinobacteria bacterium]|nr:fumarylacetoacetate hydrolase family protein [Actinomycetota bacterium]
MKIVRVRAGDDIVYGIADSEGVLVYNGSPFVAWEPTETVVPWTSATLLAPVIPTKVMCVGKNYEEHAGEMGGEVPDEPLIFMKPATAVIGPDAGVVYPRISQEVHHEAELAVVISRPARNVRAEDASRYIFGYTAANDVTARDLQRKDGQWTRA